MSIAETATNVSYILNEVFSQDLLSQDLLSQDLLERYFSRKRHREGSN